VAAIIAENGYVREIPELGGPTSERLAAPAMVMP
jgi:hypothetical protein